MTRPGSGAACASCRANAASIQPVIVCSSSSASGGKGAGGIWRVRVFSTTFSHVFGSASTAASVSKPIRLRSAFFSAELWHA